MNREFLSTEKPYRVVDELEPDGHGGEVATTTIFLTASECPVGCSMCDLYRYTLTTPTPPGAIPTQIEYALRGRVRGGWIKLYNSGNFFDPQSIPPSDYWSIADQCAGFSRVIVENHPKFGAERLLRFRDLLNLQLEIAVGLETVQPRWLERLRKQMSRDRFDRYAKWLISESIDLRVFLIIGVPGATIDESIRWARLSTRHAVAQGARHISLIPARNGHGWNDRGKELPSMPIDALAELQRLAIDDARGVATVTIDMWDVDPHGERFDELSQINRTQLASAI